MLAVEDRYSELVDQVNLAGAVQDEAASAALSRFGTILACGFVDRAVEAIVIERLSNASGHRALKFIKARLSRGTNYNSGKIVELLGLFDEEWQEAFKSFLAAHDKEKESLNSLYSVRNAVAHGRSSDISYRVLKERVEDVKAVIDGLTESIS